MWSKVAQQNVRKGHNPMTGEYQHSLDNKGRLFIPAKLRDELGDVFYVTLSMDRCLSAYSSENWKALSDKDSQGRTLIPQNLRDFAGLKQKVTVIGCNNHAELWDSEAWSDVFAQETTPENIAAVMEELEF